MPRSVVLHEDDIQKMRGLSWERNYARRELAKGYGDRRASSVLFAVTKFPFPVIGFIGDLDRDLSGMLYAWNPAVQAACSSADIGVVDCEMLATWYWSDEYWMAYVRAFQALPEPRGLFFYSWAGGRCMPTVVPKVCGLMMEQPAKKSRVVPVKVRG